MRHPSRTRSSTNKHGGRLADVVGASFKGEAEHGKAFAAEGPKHAANFFQKTAALFFVDADDFIEQAEVVAAFFGHGAKGEQIFWKTGAAIADAGIEKSRADARVGADAVADLLHVGADGFADGCDRVDEGNLHGEKCVRGVLDEFRTLGAGDDQARWTLRAVGAGNRVLAAVIPSAGERAIDLTHDLGSALVFDADDDAVGIKEVGDGGAFAQKFGIGGDVEGIRIGAIAQDDGADPLVGVNRNGTFFDDDFIAVDCAGDFTRDRFDVGHIGVAAFGGRSANGDEDGFAGAGGRLQVGGKFDALAAMAGQQLGQKLFVDRHVAGLQRLEPLLVDIDQHDLVPQIGKTGSRDKSNVSRTDDCDAHKRAFSPWRSRLHSGSSVCRFLL